MNKTTLLALIIVLSIIVFGCRALFGVPAHLRYRITIELDTPDGVRRGNAVQEVAVTTPSAAMMPVQSGSSEIKGDAVIIRAMGTDYYVLLGTCRNLATSTIDIGQVQPAAAKIAGGNSERLRAFKRTGRQAVMDGKYYLTMPYALFSVSKFVDEANWRTQRSVDAQSNEDGLHLRSVSIEPTDEPITRQAVERLPWLKTLRNEEIESSPGYNEHKYSYVKGLSDLRGKI